MSAELSLNEQRHGIQKAGSFARSLCKSLQTEFASETCFVSLQVLTSAIPLDAAGRAPIEEGRHYRLHMPSEQRYEHGKGRC